MRGAVKKLFSLLFWAYMVVSCVVLFWAALVIWLVTLPFDPLRRCVHQFSCFWGYHYIQLCPFWSSKIEGRENIPKGAAMLVANHQSLGDILLLYGLKRHFKFVSKSSIFKVPIVGWNMRLNRYISLVRGDRRSILKMFQECREHLEEGSSILMFPEGTRSSDGNIRPFKPGSFTLAKKAMVPIVPIVLDGTHDALPKSGYVLNTGQHLMVRVLPPIAPEDFPDSVEELIEKVRGQMVEALVQIRENTP